AGRERSIARAGEDGHAELGIAFVHRPDLIELVGGRPVQRVPHLRPIEGHDEQVPVALDAAEPGRDAHATGCGAPRFTPWAVGRCWSAARAPRRGATPDSRLRAAAVPAASPITITGGISRLIRWASDVAE